MADLDREERELLESVDQGEWRPVEDLEAERERYREMARATARKDRRINLRLSSRDLTALKALALEEGIPHQTLMASVLHRYVTGRLVDRRLVDRRLLGQGGDG